MRYYNIEIFKNGENISSNNPEYHFSTQLSLDGKPSSNAFSTFFNPASLRVDFEYTLTNNAIIPRMVIKIYGLDLSVIGQANHLNGRHIKFSAGYTNDLNPQAALSPGEIFTGDIKQSIGNWSLEDQENIEETASFLELYCVPSSMDFSPSPRFFNCETGDSLSDKIKSTLREYPADLTSLNGLKCPQYEYFSANNMADFIQQLSAMTNNWGKTWRKKAISGHYNGNGTITFSQQTNATKEDSSKIINFSEMIGQPNYSGSLKDEKEAQAWEVTVTTQLRSDIAIGDILTLPSSPAQNNLYGLQAFYSNANSSQSLFSGKWQVMMIHHVGQSRNPRGDKWATTFGLKRLS